MMADTVEWANLTELERIDKWREQVGREIGCNEAEIKMLIDRKQIDLHTFTGLVANGCSILLAFDILS